MVFINICIVFVIEQKLTGLLLFLLLLQVVKDPLFELAITLCIVLNTMFLALEHHGMSESVRQALDIGNKVGIHFTLFPGCPGPSKS